MGLRLTLTDGTTAHQVDVLDGGLVAVGDRQFTVERTASGRTTVSTPSSGTARAWVARDGDRVWIHLDGEVYVLEREAPGWSTSGGRRHDLLAAPMPASVRQVLVAAGDTVSKGDVLILLEAMKMELPIRAGRDGVVSAIHCREGDLVQPGVPLLDLDDPDQ
jgi:3-methylcrotonyl-CoA carboxylase alpha subunit